MLSPTSAPFTTNFSNCLHYILWLHSSSPCLCTRLLKNLIKLLRELFIRRGFDGLHNNRALINDNGERGASTPSVNISQSLRKHNLPLRRKLRCHHIRHIHTFLTGKTRHIVSLILPVSQAHAPDHHVAVLGRTVRVLTNRRGNSPSSQPPPNHIPNFHSPTRTDQVFALALSPKSRWQISAIAPSPMTLAAGP